MESARHHANPRRRDRDHPLATSRRELRARRRRRRTILDLTLAAIVLLVASLLATARPGDQNPEPAPTTQAEAAPVDGFARGSGGGDPISAGQASAMLAGRVAPSAAVSQTGSGRVRLMDIPGRDSAATNRQVRNITYAVALEGGLRVQITDFPATVRRVLTAPRGWESVDDIRFVALNPRQVAAGARPDIQIILASPTLVDRLCYPLQTHGEVSCQNNGRVVLNARRWVGGAPSYGDDLDGYRTYLVNHEVGHALGRGHVPCPGPGQRAPVMLQQTLGLDGCTPYPQPR